jgi:NAD(P)H-flavin reductase/hemoglobin-like flavoprotein
VSSGSGSGSGADQHLLALLRAIRLRQAAPDAAAAGVADAAAALTGRADSDDGRPEGGPSDTSPPAAARRGLPVAPSHYVVVPGGGAQSPRPGWAAPSGDVTEAGPDGAGRGASGGSASSGSPARSDASAAPGASTSDDGTGGPAGRDPVITPGPPAGSTPAGSAPTAGGGGRLPPAYGGVPPTTAGRTGPGRPVPPGGFFDHGPQLRPAGLPSATAGGTDVTGVPPGTVPPSAGTTPPPAGNAPLPAGNAPLPAGNAPLPAGNAPLPAGNAPPPAGTAPLPTGAVQRDVGQFGVVQPAAGRSGAVERGAGQGGVVRPGTGQSPAGQPGVTGPGAGSARAAGMSAVNPRVIGLGPGGPGPTEGNPAAEAGRARPTPDPVPGQFADELERAAELAERSWRERPGPHDPGAEVVELMWHDHPGGYGPIGAISPIEGPISGVPEVPPLFGVQPVQVPGLEISNDNAATPSPHGAAFAGEAPTRTSESIDGMDPADDALLRQTGRLLSTSLAFAGGPDEVAERLRAALLQAYPGVLAALPGNASAQTEQLAQALTWLVHNLDHPPVLVDGCGRLGAALTECGIDAQQLHLVGAALAEAMRAGMPPGSWRQDFDLAWRSSWQHAYEWILHGETLVSHQPTVWAAVVVGHELRRDDLAVVRLRPYLPMPFRPGQYARIQVPEVPGVWRPYSLTGSPREDNVLELHVRAKTTNGVSGTLVYRTNVGDRVELSRAEGQMGLPAQPQRDLLLIAGDTGVVPLKALLTELAATDDPRSAVLFWGVRNLEELYDIADITEIARSAKRATVIPVISEGNPGPYASGLVTDAVAAYGEWSNHEVYLAGPPLMLAATTAALLQLGVARDQIHHDLPE